jgi:hypothetical protein
MVAQMKLRSLVLFAALPLAAHHSTRATFDDRTLVTMQGVITEVQWTNPHFRFFIDVTGADGKVAAWEIEGPSPNALLREGLKRKTLKPGDPVTLDVWLARTPPYGRNLASMRMLTLPDGRMISGKSAWDGPIKIH